MYCVQIKDSNLTIKAQRTLLISTQVPEPDMALEAFGVYGVIHFNNLRYLVIITEARAAGTIGNKNVYEATGARALSLSRSGDEAPEVRRLLSDFFKLPGLYFSEYKLYRRQGTRSADFLFNHRPIGNYVQMFGSSGAPLVECIQGYFGRFKELALISRRSPIRAGTRFFSRGVDGSGFPSNFVETEQIVLGRNSYVQVRGSIPLEWKHDVGYGYRPPLKILGSENFLHAHRVLEKIYGRDIIYLNLIHDTGYEGELFRKYNEQLMLNNLTFYNYNFRNSISKLDFPFGFTETGFSGRGREQSAVIRTNCIDCLDRTNKMQYFIGKTILNAQLMDAGITNDASHTAYQDAFKRMFEDGGNVLSTQYAGTHAMSSTAIGMGFRSIKEPLHDFYLGVSRYFINRRCHGRMQDSYDIVTGSKTHGKVQSPGTTLSFVVKVSAVLGLSIGIFLAHSVPGKFHRVSEILLYAMLLYLLVVLLPIDYPSH